MLQGLSACCSLCLECSSSRYLYACNCQELWSLRDFSYLQANKSAQHSLRDACRRGEPPGLETKDLITHSHSSSQRVSICVSSPSPNPHRQRAAWWGPGGRAHIRWHWRRGTQSFEHASLIIMKCKQNCPLPQRKISLIYWTESNFSLCSKERHYFYLPRLFTK